MENNTKEYFYSLLGVKKELFGGYEGISAITDIEFEKLKLKYEIYR